LTIGMPNAIIMVGQGDDPKQTKTTSQVKEQVMNRTEINEVMKTIAEYTRIVEEAQAVIDANKEILKTEMKDKGIEELIGDEHKATYKAVTSNRFDSAAFKKAGFTELYNSYTKPSTSMRFTFA